MEDNPQEGHKAMFLVRHLKTDYNMEIITHRDGHHYIYLNGVKTDCFIVRSVSESDLWRVTDDAHQLTHVVDKVWYGKSKYNKSIVEGIVKKYAAEHFI